jgi:hypothetical protein
VFGGSRPGRGGGPVDHPPVRVPGDGRLRTPGVLVPAPRLPGTGRAAAGPSEPDLAVRRVPASDAAGDGNGGRAPGVMPGVGGGGTSTRAGLPALRQASRLRHGQVSVRYIRSASCVVKPSRS